MIERRLALKKPEYLPQSLIKHAENLQSPLYCINRDFSYPANLPAPKLAGEYQQQNAAGVLIVLKLLNFPVSEAAIHKGLTTTTLAGRFQILPGPITRILDVAHNPLGARKLAALLAERAASSEFIAEQLKNLGVTAINKYPAIDIAYKQILSTANEGDRIIIFGSFYTVAGVLEYTKLIKN